MRSVFDTYILVKTPYQKSYSYTK